MKLVEPFKNPILTFDCSLDLSSMERYCYNHMKHNESIERSNRNCYQSHDLPFDNFVTTFFNSIKKDIETYLDLFKLKSSVNLSNIWFNDMHKGAYCTYHDHPHCVLSAAFYVKVPKNSGDIVFYNPQRPDLYSGKFSDTTEWNDYNLGKYSIEVKENLLIIFPPWLPHSVETNTTPENRISFSFNMS